MSLLVGWIVSLPRLSNCCEDVHWYLYERLVVHRVVQGANFYSNATLVWRAHTSGGWHGDESVNSSKAGVTAIKGIMRHQHAPTVADVCLVDIHDLSASICSHAAIGVTNLLTVTGDKPFLMTASN